MKSKKIIAVLLMGMMILSTTGCRTTDNLSSDGDDAKQVIEQETDDFGMKDPASYEANLKFMVHSTGQPEYMIKKFNEKYPNINIELVLIPGQEQQAKIMSTVAAGEDIPDIFTCRTQFVKAIVNTDQYYLDLNSSPFNAGEWINEIEPYVVNTGTDSSGALRALSWQCPVGGIYYRRSIAIDMFGTDDPEKIAKVFSSFDSIVDAARTVKEKSNGSIYFTAEAIQDLVNLGVTDAGGFVLDGKVNTNEAITKLFKYGKIFYDEGLTLGSLSNGTATAAATSEGKVFTTSKPTWGLNYIIMPNFPEQVGDWALTSGPYPYTCGGTWIGISKDTKYQEECYLFMKFIMTDKDFIRSYALEVGDYVSNKKIQEEIGAYTEEECADLDIVNYLNGQNPYVYWNGELERGINADAFSPYDEFFGKYLMTAIESYALGNLTLEEAVEQYESDCLSYAPALNVE